MTMKLPWSQNLSVVEKWSLIRNMTMTLPWSQNLSIVDSSLFNSNLLLTNKKKGNTEHIEIHKTLLIYLISIFKGQGYIIKTATETSNTVHVRGLFKSSI